MVDSQPMSNPGSPVMPGDREAIKTEAPHDLRHVQGHRSLGVRGMAGR